MSVKGAKGLVYDTGGVRRMAKGGFYTRPTLVPMASGGTALVGEAGTEAAMPLTKNSRGQLSVHAVAEPARQASAVPNVSFQFVNQTGAAIEAENVGYSVDPEQMVVSIVLRNQQRGGPLRNRYSRG